MHNFGESESKAKREEGERGAVKGSSCKCSNESSELSLSEVIIIFHVFVYIVSFLYL